MEEEDLNADCVKTEEKKYFAVPRSVREKIIETFC